jgi:hypothetical protein
MDEVDRRFACGRSRGGRARRRRTRGGRNGGHLDLKPLDSNGFSPLGGEMGRWRRRACPQASAIMVTEPLTTFERYDFAEVSISIRDL